MSCSARRRVSCPGTKKVAKAHSACLDYGTIIVYIGTWKGEVLVPATKLSDQDSRLQGEENALFLKFMRKLLQWKPEERKGIRDITEHEWLLADLIESGQVVRG